jgi:hypothetical protein
LDDFEEIFERCGTFNLDMQDMAFHPDFWSRILSNVLVTRCEHLLWEGALTYVGYSKLFRHIEEGMKPSFYRFDTDEFNDIVAIETKEMEITRFRERNGQTTNKRRGREDYH